MRRQLAAIIFGDRCSCGDLCGLQPACFRAQSCG